MGKMYQIQTAFAASFSCFVMGLLNVWPSYTIKQYTAINGTTILTVPMSEFESSFLGSAPSLGAILGTAVVSITIDSLGRKKGGVLIALPAAISWAIIEISTSSLPILVARFIGGISGGAGLVFAPIFISEVVDDSIRGMLASTPMVCYCSGALISYLLGWFSTYHTIVRFNIAVCVLSVVLLMLVKESPVFLLKTNQEEEARAAIAHYRGATTSSKTVLEELSRLKLQIMPAVELITVSAPDEAAEKEVLNPNHEVSQETTEKQPAWKTLFVSPSSRRAFIVVGVVLTLQVLMGMIAVQVYSEKLFASAAPDLIPDLCSVLLAIVLLSGCLIAAAIADKAGRRPLQISSCALAGGCMVFMGVLLQTRFAPPWLTAVMVLLFCLSFNFGAGTVPYVLIAEVFVPEVQGIASTLLIEWVWFLNFFIIQVFPTLLSLLGLHGAFYVFGVVGFANAVISYYIVPETKGLSNDQVQVLFRRKNCGSENDSVCNNIKLLKQ